MFDPFAEVKDRTHGATANPRAQASDDVSPRAHAGAECSPLPHHEGALSDLGRERQGLVGARTSLISSRGHSMLLNYDRARFISARLSAAALFLAIATIAWIPIDVTLLDERWTVLWPLMAARLVTGLLFLAVASLQFRTAGLREELLLLGLVICVGVGFLLYTHHVLATAAGGAFDSGPAHTAYSLFPAALAAGLAIFPLTLGEIAALLLVPALALLGDLFLEGSKSIFIEHGPVMFLLGAIVAATMVCSLSQLQLLIRLHEQSTIDPLTHLLSRRAGSELLNVLFAKSERTGSHFSVLLLDLDNFKRVNDFYGHNAGDFLLRHVAHSLRQALRGEDLVIRWGGEEFLIVLSRATSSVAAKAIVSLCLPGLGERPDGMRQTASVGLAERIEDQARTWQDLVEIADERMYRAKVEGRNCLISTDGTPRRLSAGTGLPSSPARFVDARPGKRGAETEPRTGAAA